MKASHLKLAYGTSNIYDDCSFHIEPGDKVGVIGVNGAGKSTLFRVILGQQSLDDGEISLESVRIGFLPQEIIIEPRHGDLTVWDYIAAGRPVDDLQERLNAEYEKLAKYPNSAAILDRIQTLQDQIDSYDLSSFDHELMRVIEKMGLESLMEQKMSELSGGQKSKVAFARVLFENAGLLLLDEPTNHLDSSTKLFISNFLRNYQGTVLVISHDVDFLNTVTNKTLFVNKTTHKIKLYKGNYAAFRRQYAAEKAAEDQRISLEEREIKRLEEFVKRARAAKRSNTALIGMGHQREKVLEKRLAALETRETEYARVEIHITPRSVGGRTPLEIQNLSFTYPDGPEIYNRLSFSLDRGEKFLIVGENGVGKSTLLKLIVGGYPELRENVVKNTTLLKPNSGSIIFGHGTTLSYYAQELELLDPRRTIFDNVRTYDFTDTDLRGILNNFLFAGDDIYKKVEILSPGEKARVALCKTLLERANLLILDEPTNHFDPETQKIIGENLRNYPGTIIMVSHNPAFVEQIGITRMLVVPPLNDQSRQAIIKNFSPELLEYYYYLNSDLV
jgi:ATP-binding cassette subfamily F protein 3